MGIFGPPLVPPARPSSLLETLSPISVGTLDFDVDLTGKTGLRPWKLKLANESLYALQVDVGGYVDWISPFSVDVVPTGGATRMHVHPVALSSPFPTPPWSVLLVTLAPQGEEIPGTYPVALNRQSASYMQQTVLGQVTAPTGLTNSQDFSITAGSLAIGFAVRTDHGNLRPTLVVVTGDQTNLQYFSVLPTSTTVLARALDVTDTSVTVAVTAQGGGPALVDVLAWPVLPVAAVVQNPGDQLTTILNGFGAAVPVDVLGATPAMVVSNVGATPAGWQAFPRSVSIDTNWTSGADNTVVAAVGNQSISLGGTWRISSAAAMKLALYDGPSANNLEITRFLTQGAGLDPILFKGRMLTAGNALVGKLLSATAEVVLSGSYNQR